MKFCPTCQTRYDEEILRFCTKDGTPLIEENQPVFTELPSEIDEDDFSEETVIRRNKPAAASDSEFVQPTSSPRIVIPTSQPAEEIISPPIRPKVITEYQIQPRKTNTAKIVLLTLLGTFVILGGIGALFLISRDSNGENLNQNISVNTNFGSVDTNLNTNLNIGNSLANFNAGVNSNANINTNINTNLNANLKTPTPTPKPSASPTPTPNLNTNVNAGNTNASVTPTPANTKPSTTPTPAPAPSPKTSPSDIPPNSNRPVNAGVLNGRAVNLPKPAYPPLAKQMRASGQVAVQISIDEAGNVTSARATSGNILLRAPAEAAARQSKINPVKIGDVPVQAVGILLYNFSNQ